MSPIVCICDEIIIKSEGGVAKIRSKIIIVRHNKVYAVCKSCGVEVGVPLAPVHQDVLTLPVRAIDAPQLTGPALFLKR